MFDPITSGGRTCGRLAGGLLLFGLVGCATAPQPGIDLYPLPPPGMPARTPAPGSAITQAAHQEPVEKTPIADAKGSKGASIPVHVDDLVQLAIGRNPRLGKATFAIDAAQGKYVQAGLYPNPNLAVTADELGDRTGPGGIITAPQVSQEIVTGRKLSLSQAVVAKEVDQSTLALLRERYGVVGSVRAAFYDLYALERRIAVLDELTKLAGEAVKNGQTLLDAKQIARLDLVQLEVELARFRAQGEAARQELPGTRKRLAALVGDPRLPIGSAAGPFEDVPVYDPERTLEVVLATNPEVRSARVGVERAQAAIRRAEVEPIPNLTLSTGYTYQGQNKSNDWLLGVSARSRRGTATRVTSGQPRPNWAWRSRRSGGSRTTWPNGWRPR